MDPSWHISYAADARQWTYELADFLQAAGIRVILAPLESRSEHRDVLDRIKGADRLFVVCTPEYRRLAQGMDWPPDLPLKVAYSLLVTGSDEAFVPDVIRANPVIDLRSFNVLAAAEHLLRELGPPLPWRLLRNVASVADAPLGNMHLQVSLQRLCSVESLRSIEESVDRLLELSSTIRSPQRKPRKKRNRDVFFTASVPGSLARNRSGVAYFWAHLESERAKVEKLAADLDGKVTPSIGPARVTRGTILEIELVATTLRVSEPRASLRWTGKLACCTFPIRAAAKAALGDHDATFVVRIAGLKIASVHVTICVGAGRDAERTRRSATTRGHCSAFASYATPDRDRVLDLISGMVKQNPVLKVFLDVDDLRSGDRWKKRLGEEIRSREVFYLFWSVPASASKWVDFEWRTALKHGGPDFIDPVPLASPDEAPPPKELEQHHFNDRYLYFRSSRQERATTSRPKRGGQRSRRRLP